MRHICGVAAALLVAVLTAGCGGGGGAPMSDISLVFAGRTGGDWDIYSVRGATVAPVQAMAGDQLNPSLDDHRRTCVFESRAGGDGDIMIVRLPDGPVTGLVVGPSDDRDPAISMDGTKVAFVRWGAGGADLWLINSDGTGLVQLTDWNGDEVDPAWSADGRAVYFAANRDGNFDIYRIELHGTGVAKVAGGAGDQRYPTLQGVFERIVFASNADGDWELYVKNARDLDGPATKITDNAVDDIQPCFDGSHVGADTIVYATNEGGAWHVKKMRTAPVRPASDVDTGGVEAWQPAF